MEYFVIFCFSFNEQKIKINDLNINVFISITMLCKTFTKQSLNEIKSNAAQTKANKQNFFIYTHLERQVSIRMSLLLCLMHFIHLAKISFVYIHFPFLCLFGKACYLAK